MKAHLVPLSVCLFLIAAVASPRESGAALDGCMACHGDEATMKSMVKPAIQVTGEGEG